MNENFQTLPINSVINIFKQVINGIQSLHTAGYVYNDIKPSNILLDNKMKVTIIDYRCAKKFTDSKNHLECVEVEEFLGNIQFSSYNQMNFMSTSRKDDLISAFQLLFVMLNHGYYPYLELEELGKMGLDMKKQFKYFKELKSNHSLKEISRNL
jgi:eukaryotic-like serine/threonine-protein kinase